MRIDERLGTLAEEYHLASRNQAGYKSIYKAHQVHYAPHVQQLMAEAPLHLDGLRRVLLPEARSPANMPLERVILNRTSGRQFAPLALPAEQLATLLYLGNAVRQAVGQDGHVYFQRNVPNSGNLGSVEVFPIVLNVTDIEPGIYHFDTVKHDLAQLKVGHYSTWLRERVLFQLEFAEAAVALVLTCSTGRLSTKYGLRGYRLGMLDVGHVSENIYLVGTSLGLQVCATAGFIDDELDRAVGIDGVEHASMLVLLVGPSVSAASESTELAAEPR
jgi:SagB-type dehydrogenase family enzyme